MRLSLLFSTTALSLAALSPAISQAAPESEALSACTRAFESSVAADAASSRVFKLKYTAGQPASAWSNFFTREYTFFLKARDPKTGAALASATCRATAGGSLIALEATANDAPVLSAKF
jgi:hypothetical protein